MSAIKRIEREFKAMKSNNDGELLRYSVGRYDDDIFKWRATLIGPKGTPYEDGVFEIDIEFPEEYPFKPPKFKFKTQVYHPNIDSKGSICINILKDNWTPVLSVEKVLMSISILLTDPNPDDPLVPHIGEQLKKSQVEFETTAREWTVKHAYK